MTSWSVRPLLHRRGLSVLAVVISVVPFVVAGVCAAAGPWVPIRDDAYFTARSLDVATANHPLLGAWSAGSLDVGTAINNLGPLQLDLLAPFTRLAPMGGTAIGVITVHIAAIVVIAVVIGRLAGPRYVVATMAAVAVLAWTLGSEMLITPQQHQYLLLSYLCVLVCAWAVTSGDRWALVPAVFFASLVAQTHLSYPILLAALGVPMIAGQIVASRRASPSHASAGAVRTAEHSVTPFVVATVLAAVLWLQTAIEQFALSGNFANVLTTGGEADTPSGGTAVSIVAEALVSPQGYLRPGYAEFDPENSLASDAQVALLVATMVALGIGVVVAARRGHRRAAAGLAVAVTSLLAAIVNAAMLPITLGFGLLASNYRWLWPIGTFLVLGALCLVVRVAPSISHRGVEVAIGVLSAVVILASIANLPRSIQIPNAELYRRDQTSTQRVLDQLRDVGFDGPVIIDQSHMYLGHPYTYPILTVLRSRGIDYRFEEALQSRRFGDERVTDGSERQRLVMWFGDDARALRGDADTVVYVEGEPAAALTLTPVSSEAG